MAIIGNPIINTNYATDSFSGDSSTVAFTLSQAPASAASIAVYISGLYQIPGSAYTVSGTTLTFTGAPPTGTSNIIVLYLGLRNQNLVPVNGSITPQMLNNANVVYWSTSNNNVGIGTTTPGNPLHISVASNNGLKIDAANGYPAIWWAEGGTNKWSITSNLNADSGFVIRESGVADRIAILPSSGNVGIGTSTPATKLDVAGRVQLTNAAYNYLLVDSTSSDSYLRLASAGTVKWYLRNNVNNSHALEITPDAGSSAGLFLTQSGRVGISTTTPMSLVHIKGDTTAADTDGVLVVENGMNNGYETLKLYTTGGYNCSMSFRSNNYWIGMGIDQSDSGKFKINTDNLLNAGNNILTITQAGNIGVGTTSPAVALDASSKTTAIYLPKGTTAQRPSSASGLMRYNTTGQWMEYYDGQEWVPMIFGAYLHTWTTGTYSLDAGSTWRNMGSISCPDFGNRPKVLSIAFDGYITSGTYYWTWRLYNATTGAVLPSLGGYHSRSSYVSSGGGIQYRGNVHSMSGQPARAFDASGCSWQDTIRLELSAASGEGDAVYTNAAQTLYVDNLNWWMGALSGKETDTFWTA